MTIDPKRVKAIFLEAAELSDEAARAAYLDQTCEADAGVRERIEALLRAHDKEGSFLGTPAAVVPNPDHEATQAQTGTRDPGVTASQTTADGNSASDDEALTFLAPPTRPDSLGRIGHYEVLQVLGRGGFGIVFRAFDEMLQRVVALKVMAPQLAATSPARKRFLREARSSAQVRHENVVQVYEVAEQPLPYLAMEFIPGETLQQKLDRVGPLDVLEVLHLGRQIAEGLAAAHATDLIHRDIKPGNVLLEGGQHKVKITDFGLARAADDASISQSGLIAGTPMYMAPEQALGQTLDQRADLFSLGSVLYQMVAGRPPFRANSAVAVLKRVAEDRPRAIREIIPETPPWLCDIIAKLHAKDPDDRYQSAREVADVLADCEAQLKANARLKDFSRIPRSKPRRSARWKWVVAALVLVVAAPVLVALASVGLYALTRSGPNSVGPRTNPAPGPDDSKSEGWVQLFNGKDLTGWKKDPRFPGFWRVDENGILIGAGPIEQDAFLDTERDNFEDFHLRVEAKVDTPKSDSGVFFRVPFLPSADQPPDFDEINIGFDPTRPKKQTGSLLIQKGSKATWLAAATGLAKPKEWFVLEIIARGDRVVTKVNGKAALETRTTSGNHRGHILLQQYGPETTVRFKKIEIKELPPATARTGSAAEDQAALDAKQAQEASAKQLGIPVETTNSIGMKLRFIPAGKFTMGSSQDEIDFWIKQNDDFFRDRLLREGPQHEVEITQPFYMGQTEVTVGQFRPFVKATGFKTQAERDGGALRGFPDGHFEGVANTSWLDPGYAQTDDHPVVCVCWNDAVEFCKWLSKQEGKTYRLPTEAEWELSCRAGSKGRWSFGDNEGALCDYERVGGNSQTHSWPVAGLKANAWGLYDMHGNVSENCQDVYDRDYYKTSPPQDPPGPAAGDKRAIRGGNWLWHDAWSNRSASRHNYDPAGCGNFGGFRVVRVESSPKTKTPPLAIAPFSDADVQRIAALPAAEQVEEVRKELKRRNPGFDGKMETRIEGGVVTEFHIESDKVTDIAPIRVFDALRMLACGGTTTNDVPHGLLADLTPLDGMNLASLTHLGLWSTKVNDAGMAYFKDCKRLTHLGLGQTKVSDAGLANFKDCKELAVLWLPNTQVGDAGVAHLQDCTALTELNLAGTKVSDVGLAYFKGCKNLKNLYVDRTLVDDAGLAQFARMPLRELAIYDTAITDLTPLQGMPLEFLTFTPKNITRGLDILRDMKSLKTIGIAWRQTSPAAEFWERYDKGEFKE